MKKQILTAVVLIGCATIASASEEYELRVPVGWGDLTQSDFCTRVNIEGQSGCGLAPVQLPGDVSMNATFFRAKGALEEIEKLGDFFPFPWSDKARLSIDQLRKENVEPNDIEITIKACNVATVAPGCTCIDKPGGGMQIVCNEDERALPPITIPPMPPGYLRSVQ